MSRSEKIPDSQADTGIDHPNLIENRQPSGGARPPSPLFNTTTGLSTLPANNNLPPNPDDDPPEPAAPAARKPRPIREFSALIGSGVGLLAPIAMVAGNQSLNNFSKFKQAIESGDPQAFAFVSLTAIAFFSAASMWSFISRASKDDEARRLQSENMRLIHKEITRNRKVLAAMAAEASETRRLQLAGAQVQIVPDTDAYWANVQGEYVGIGGFMTYDVRDRILPDGTVELLRTERLLNWARRLANEKVESMRITVYLPKDINRAFRPLAWRAARKIEFALTEAEKICLEKGWTPNMKKVRIRVIPEQQPMPPGFAFSRDLGNGETEKVVVQYWQPQTTDHPQALRSQQLVVWRGAACTVHTGDLMFEWYRGREVSLSELRELLRLRKVPVQSTGVSTGDTHTTF